MLPTTCSATSLLSAWCMQFGMEELETCIIMILMMMILNFLNLLAIFFYFLLHVLFMRFKKSLAFWIFTVFYYPT